MSAIEAAEFVRGVSTKYYRVKSYRLRMRRAALQWRHARRFSQWETAYVSLYAAVECRNMAKLIGGAL